MFAEGTIVVYGSGAVGSKRAQVLESRSDKTKILILEGHYRGCAWIVKNNTLKEA